MTVGARGAIARMARRWRLWSWIGLAVAMGVGLGWVPLFGVLGFELAAASALWRWYSEPPVFTYNAILGYFPGNLYDENIQLQSPLAWSRLEELAAVVAVVALVAFRLDVPRHRASWREVRPAGRRLAAL